MTFCTNAICFAFSDSSLINFENEFDKFADALTMTPPRLEQASSELDKLVGGRTRQIQRKLRGVASLPEEQSAALFPEEQLPPMEDELEV